MNDLNIVNELSKELSSTFDNQEDLNNLDITETTVFKIPVHVDYETLKHSYFEIHCTRKQAMYNASFVVDKVFYINEAAKIPTLELNESELEYFKKKYNSLAFLEVVYDISF